jgi:DNA helicase-2/ATP-dependent DNA helicase PcrA
MTDLSQLNPAQKEAVLQTEGPIMILAGAGSGKTRTLVTRITHILDDLETSPYQVLALTFSNKAAREMRERVAKQVEVDAGALQITTFHAFCSRILRSEATHIGLSRNFTIYGDGESKAIAKNILTRHGISTKEISPFEVLSYISDIKNHGHFIGRKSLGERGDGADEFYIDTQDPFYSYYREYEDELHRANAVDFGGLITGVIQLFETYPDLLERYQDRFKYVLVDEYQDTNRAQFELIRMLCEKRRNICVVGDEDQSIYSWRGADIHNILDFEKIFKEVKVLKLEQNYRSSKNIIEAASCVIARNAQRKGKNMWTDNPQGDSIDVVELTSDKNEAEYVAREAKRIVSNQKEKNSFDDIAVFYRTNSQSRIIEDYLRKNRIPYRVIGGVKFYERKEVKDLLAYVRLLVNSKDSLALSRIVNIPTRGIGATTLRKLEDEAIKSNCSLWDVLEDIVSSPAKYKHIRISAKVKSGLREFVSLLQETMMLEEKKELPSEIYSKLLYDSGYWEFLRASKEYEAAARMENLQELENAIKQYELAEDGKEEPTLTGFLETITLDQTSEVDKVEAQGEVSLMTIHGAKGLEFPYAFIVGAEENIFPSFRSLEEGEQGLEEERRLFYVAMTRAMKHLYILFAQGRMLFGQLKFNGPSRFINEIPEKYYVWKGEKKVKQSFQESEDDYSQEVFYEDDVVEYQVESKKSKIENSYIDGSKIVHTLYGEGEVLKTDGFGKEEKVLIQFKDGAKKRFMVQFAPLTLIE